MPRESAQGRVERLAMYQSFIESGQTVAEFSRERGTTPWKVKSAVRKSEAETASGSGFKEVSLAPAGGGDFRVPIQRLR